MPATPFTIWQAIQQAKSRQSHDGERAVRP
jgi:hypothetical protein